MNKMMAMLLLSVCCATQVLGGSPEARSNQSNQRWIEEQEFPSGKAGPSVVHADTEGNIWVALARAGKIAKVTGPSVREYVLPPKSFPVGVTTDGRGSVWYSDIRRNKIGRLDPANGSLIEYEVPTKNSWPFFLGIAPDGRLWFTERVGNKIGRLDPTDGKIDEFEVPTKDCQPAGLTVTPDGVVYFTENSGHKIGRVEVRSAKVTELAVPSVLKRSPFYGLAGITSDTHGTVWFAELDGRLGKIERSKGIADVISEVPVPDAAVRPAGVAVDRWGAVWFTELDGNAISSYNPAIGRFERYPIPTGSPDPRPLGPPEATARGEIPTPGTSARTSRPFGIAVDGHNNIWFSEQYAHKLGILRPPAIRVFAPAGEVSDTSTRVVVRLRSDHGMQGVRYYLNGVEVPVSTTLGLSRITAGPATFRVELENDGTTLRDESNFVFAPNLTALRDVIRRAFDRGQLSHEQRDQLCRPLDEAASQLKAGKTSLARETEREMVRDLIAGRYKVPSSFAQLLAADLHWMDAFGVRHYVVRVSGRSLQVTPRVLEIEVGDTVTWKYEGAAGGGPAQFASPSPFLSAVRLMPGREWSYTFRRPERVSYSLAMDQRPAAEIRVRARERLMYEFPLPGQDRVPGVLAIDAEGNVWFTEGGGGYSKLASIPLNNKIGRLSPDGTVKEYETATKESAPTSIHMGKEGHVWFTERAGNHLGELDPVTGAITEYEIPTPSSGTTGITVTPDGKIWYASKAVSKVGVFDPIARHFREFDTPTPKSQPSTITYDPAGNIWFDERASDRIVRLNPQTDEMKEYQVPTRGSRTVGLVPDGNDQVWFLELGANKVGCLHVATAQVTEFAIPTPFSSPFKEALDASGRLWFTEVFGNKIAVLDHGRFTEYLIPSPEAMPGGISIDSKGNLWFTEQAANKLAMIPADVALLGNKVYAAGNPGEQHAHHHVYSGGATQ